MMCIGKKETKSAAIALALNPVKWCKNTKLRLFNWVNPIKYALRNATHYLSG